MRSMQKFTGINNVLEAAELSDAELTVGLNIDVDQAGRARRRAGYASASATRHGNVWSAAGFDLATRGAAGDLVNLDDDTVLVPALGHARVWYCNLPDGRTLYGNGTQQGIVSGAAAQAWGVPVPATLGVAADTAGDLHPGKYQWALTHVRLSDGAESGPIYSGAGAIDVALGGISFTDLPVPAGYRTNVYLTSHYGGARFFAGSSTDGTFTFTSSNAQLQRRCPTDMLQPPPLGKLHAFWRGRTLVAVGNALFASRPNAWELFDLQRDFKHFSAPITLVQPAGSGIWLGTEKELVFLAGDSWDKLARIVKAAVPVVLGSGVHVPGEWLRVGDGVGEGDCMVCIAGGYIVGGTAGGGLVPLSAGRYRTDVSEVAATFRVVNEIPQYIAVPQ
jgi:hypothetical protein